MISFHAATQTIVNGLKTQQIGQPVAVRIVAHISADHGQIELLSAEALEHATAWLGGETDRLAVAGGAESGELPEPEQPRE